MLDKIHDKSTSTSPNNLQVVYNKWKVYLLTYFTNARQIEWLELEHDADHLQPCYLDSLVIVVNHETVYNSYYTGFHGSTTGSSRPRAGYACGPWLSSVTNNTCHVCDTGFTGWLLGVVVISRSTEMKSISFMTRCH